MTYLSRLRAVAVAALVVTAALIAPLAVRAQTVTQLPIYTQNNPNQVVDLGNGPTELRVLTGNAQIWTSQGTGTSGNNTSSSTSLTVTATPASPPCVGCIISGTGITSGTTVTATSGTSITLSAAMSVATSTTLAWGAACPSTVSGASPLMLVQAGVGGDLPLYTQARVCSSGQFAAGATLLQFPIGAH